MIWSILNFNILILRYFWHFEHGVYINNYKRDICHARTRYICSIYSVPFQFPPLVLCNHIGETEMALAGSGYYSTMTIDMIIFRWVFWYFDLLNVVLDKTESPYIWLYKSSKNNVCPLKVVMDGRKIMIESFLLISISFINYHSFLWIYL